MFSMRQGATATRGSKAGSDSDQGLGTAWASNLIADNLESQFNVHDVQLPKRPQHLRHQINT